MNSAVILNNPYSENPSFIPDLPGIYVIQLIVNDGTVDSQPSALTISAVTKETAAISKIQEIIEIINSLDPGKFNNPNNKKALTNKLNTVMKDLENENYQGAFQKLENDIIPKMDGCALNGNPDKNDWIRDCSSQTLAYPLMIDVIELLETL